MVAEIEKMVGWERGGDDGDGDKMGMELELGMGMVTVMGMVTTMVTRVGTVMGCCPLTPQCTCLTSGRCHGRRSR